MTPAMRAQVDYCKQLIREGETPAQLLHQGYAAVAINRAIQEMEGKNDS